MVLFQVLGLGARQVLLALAGQTCRHQSLSTLLTAGLAERLGKNNAIVKNSLIS